MSKLAHATPRSVSANFLSHMADDVHETAELLTEAAWTIDKSETNARTLLMKAGEALDVLKGRMEEFLRNR